ncbi:MAG: hypothetical protein GXY16_04960 [Syntrophomonadaceae bacterium]|nr:hypothetical protein [Syntrophomonadaceae bacterium]
MAKAQQIWKRHQIIRDFLMKVLHVSVVVADRDACMMGML